MFSMCFPVFYKKMPYCKYFFTRHWLWNSWIVGLKALIFCQLLPFLWPSLSSGGMCISSPLPETPLQPSRAPEQHCMMVGPHMLQPVIAFTVAFIRRNVHFLPPLPKQPLSSHPCVRWKTTMTCCDLHTHGE